MSRNVKVPIALVALFAVVVTVIAIASGSDDESPATRTTIAEAPTTTGSAAPARPRVVTDDPRRLGRPGRGGVTFTEFLDFECEGCGAAYPLVEQLREKYDGRVTFNIRYFPLPGHRNARPAALAVEAAHQQGKLEPMYRRMFETQRQWGEQSDSQAATFRGFAKDLGLDLARFDADVASPRTRRRVERDLAAGAALGLQGTPTFFVNERMIQPQSSEDLGREIDAALAGS